MKAKHIFQVAIFILVSFSIYGTFGLVKNEWINGNICPRLLGIPACYIIMGCFLLAFIGNLSPKKLGFLFYIGVLPALSIATYGSLGELFGFAECPKTSSGTPMCFISFSIFFSLLILKLLHQKFSK